MSKAIQYIYHLADIHIRNHERHDEYRRVFTKLYDKLRTEERGIIVLAGDIFHNKTSMSPEAIQLTTELLKNLSEISHVILIPGNHDGNVNNTVYSMDCLTPIVNAIERDKLTYMKEGGVYEYKNMLIGVSSVFENNVVHQLNDKQRKSKKKKIYLYHGPVYGCKNTAGYKLKSDVKVDDFEGYDIVMLGDIHQFQYLNEAKTMAYSGSLIQQDYGESVDCHGYVKWNLQTNTSTFVPVENDTAYVIATPDNHHEVIQKLQTELAYVTNIRLRIDYTNASIEKLKQIEEMMSSKYKIIELTYKQIHVNEGSSTLVNQTTPNTEPIINKVEIYTPIINAYLSKPEYSVFTNEEKEQVKNNILTKISQSKSTQPRWKLLRLKWFNMFCYDGEQEIYFSNLNGIIGIVGNNAIGKSSIIDILMFTLFHQTTKFGLTQLRELKYLRNMLNTSKVDNYYAEVEFVINNKVYLIRREVFKTKQTTKAKTVAIDDVNYDVNVFQKNDTLTNTDDVGEWVKISSETKTKTNKMIEDMIGTFDDFVNYFVMIQKNEHGFIEMSQEDRKKIINQASHLDGIMDLFDKAKTDFQEVKVRNKLIQQEIEKIDVMALNELKKQLEQDIETNNNTRQRYQLELTEMEREMSFFDVGNVTIVKSSIDIQTEINELDIYIESLRHKLDTSHEHITALKSVLQQSKETQSVLADQLKTYDIERQVLKKTVDENVEEVDTKYTYDELQTKVQTLQSFFSKHTEEEITEMKQQHTLNQNTHTKIEMIEQNIGNINLEYNPDCQVCLKKNAKEIAKVNELKMQMNKLRESIIPVDLKVMETFANNKKKLKLYQQQITFLESQEAIHKIQDLTALIDRITVDKRNVDKKINDTNKDIENYKQIVEKTVIESNKATVKKDVLSKQYTETVVKEQMIENNKSLFEQKDKLTNKIKEITKLIHKMELENVTKMKDIESINGKINEYNTKFDQFQHSQIVQLKTELLFNLYGKNGVVVELSKVMLNNLTTQVNNLIRIKNILVKLEMNEKGLNVIVCKNGVEYMVHASSGSERTIINFAFRIALSNMSNCPMPNMLILDEGFTSFDQNALMNLRDVFDNIIKYFDTIIIISHLEALKTYCNKNIFIVRDGLHSRIKIETVME